ncbi:MAG TPA: response regulator, partial [Thermoanaerobaculaceae bacterium]|nr:response regulator [Thermoanaerobaculaceae bacterium]
HVTPAGSGEEALAIAGRETFDLLLSDIRLPGIQGGDLARTLVAQHPRLRVILMSGYTEDAAVRAEASSGRVRFLQKPFSMDAVAAEVAAALQT